MLTRHYYLLKQECIPVGCVPAVRRPYAGVCFPGGVCSTGEGGCLLPGGLSAPGGCLLPGVVCLGDLLRGGGVCSWGVSQLVDCMLESASGGVVSASRGVVSAPGGGICSQGGIPACIEADPLPPPPVNRMTSRCKNITLATTSLRLVINTKWKIWQ